MADDAFFFEKSPQLLPHLNTFPFPWLLSYTAGTRSKRSTALQQLAKPWLAWPRLRPGRSRKKRVVPPRVREEARGSALDGKDEEEVVGLVGEDEDEGARPDGKREEAVSPWHLSVGMQRAKRKGKRNAKNIVSFFRCFYFLLLNFLLRKSWDFHDQINVVLTKSYVRIVD